MGLKSQLHDLKFRVRVMVFNATFNTISVTGISWRAYVIVVRKVILYTKLFIHLYIPVSSTNKTDCHNITEILLKVALNTITPLLQVMSL
jgi:hypothetical protein